VCHPLKVHIQTVSASLIHSKSLPTYKTAGSYIVMLTVTSPSFGANTERYTDRGLPSKQTFYYRVRAANLGGYSAYSKIAKEAIA